MKYNLSAKDSYGNSIEILQQLPSKGDIFPTVMMIPGFGADMHEFGLFDDVSKVLVNSGIQTFRFNFAGLGKSSGTYENTTLQLQIHETETVLKYILKDRFTSQGHIGILAHGLGGIVAIFSKLPGVHTLVFSDILLDPYSSLSKWFKRERGFNPENISKRNRSDRTQVKIRSQFWTGLEKLDVLEKISMFTQSIMLIHSSKNTVSKAIDSHEIYNTLNTRKKFVVVQDARQSYSGKARHVYIKLVKDWFNENL